MHKFGSTHQIGAGAEGNVGALFVVQLHPGDCDLAASPDDVGGGDKLVAAARAQVVHP